MRVGDRPTMDQPVGIVSVVTRHCAPATSTLPDGMSRTAADFRGTWIARGTPDMSVHANLVVPLQVALDDLLDRQAGRRGHRGNVRRELVIIANLDLAPLPHGLGAHRPVQQAFDRALHLCVVGHQRIEVDQQVDEGGHALGESDRRRIGERAIERKHRGTRRVADLVPERHQQRMVCHRRERRPTCAGSRARVRQGSAHEGTEHDALGL